MDRIAREGRCGRMITIPDGFHPGSEVAGALLLFCRKFKLTDAKMAQIAEELRHDEAGLDR